MQLCLKSFVVTKVELKNLNKIAEDDKNDNNLCRDEYLWHFYGSLARYTAGNFHPTSKRPYRLISLVDSARQWPDRRDFSACKSTDSSHRHGRNRARSDRRQGPRQFDSTAKSRVFIGCQKTTFQLSILAKRGFQIGFMNKIGPKIVLANQKTGLSNLHHKGQVF